MSGAGAGGIVATIAGGIAGGGGEAVGWGIVACAATAGS